MLSPRATSKGQWGLHTVAAWLGAGGRGLGREGFDTVCWCHAELDTVTVTAAALPLVGLIALAFSFLTA
jgi:hypothetical protein